MLSDQLDQAERRAVLRNDQRVREQQREQGSTYLAHSHDDLGGRYAQISPQIVVGAQPTMNYPAASPHQFDPCGTEPPLGYRVDALHPDDLGPSSQAQGVGPASEAHSGVDLPPDVSRPDAGSSFRRRRL